MAFSLGITHLSLLSFFTLALLAQARLNLDPSDYNALLTIEKDLGINSQHHHAESPCNSAGVICERRVSNNTYVLRITRIVFKSQRLTGLISPAIGRLSELKELSLPNNKLVDQIPPQIVDCRKLEILNLRNNQFSGEVPSELSALIRLRILDLSSNKFSGNLSFLKYFPNMEKLSLAVNMFTGKVPASLRSFRNLRFFNISGNSFLEGPVPVMNRVEYSSSQLVGEKTVPKRYIFAENSLSRNPTNSAIAPSASKDSSASPAQAPAPSAMHHKHKNVKRKLGGWILGFLAGALAGSAAGLIFSAFFKTILVMIKGGVKDGGPSIFSQLIKKAEDLAFLEKEDGVASLEIIGRGGCGEVYRAELPGSNGKLIAIKKIIQPPKDAAELTEEDSKLLNKKMRQIKSEIETVGTLGYIAPEYHQTLKFTEKCDIYSFGVLLGVLVIGKLPSDDFFQTTNEMNLVKWMRNMITSERPSTAIDPNLMGNGFEEQMLLVLKIACFCTHENPKDRPNSKEVRCMLSQIKH
ncbi:hypothetical protein F0562_023351 [Nyssa sinensis]|uniref:Protein kinase domain-containing protein n=1 Tax=Nyssa sinensis TaxID=561372 RepID=A0A5J5BHI6_9ASTE|nr:hypothetical protein F0562_023351 [Nyssa sinensis]